MIMYTQPILLLLAILSTNLVVACSHNGAAAAVYAVRRRSLQPDTVQNARRAQPTPVAITKVKYFTGRGLSALSTVQFSNGIITAILPGGNTGVPPNYQVVNGNVSTLLPGLVESHTHPTNIAELQTLTSYGITTALGMGCPYVDNCDALRKQNGLADFYSAGIAACTPGSVHATVLALPPQDLIYNANAQHSVTALYKAGVTILCRTDSDDILGPSATAYGSSMYDEARKPRSGRVIACASSERGHLCSGSTLRLLCPGNHCCGQACGSFTHW